MAKKPLEIDMIAGSQLRDTQGEMLSVEGADISELEAGRGRINDNHGKGFFNAIGRVTGAKKIFKREDCDNERQEYYWDKVKAPYIYVKAELFDDEDHPNARAAAAILRNIHKSDTPLQLKASVEGGVVARGIADNSLLARTKVHSVALTFTPANNATLVEPLSLNKTETDEASDMILIKSVLHLAETNVPSFRHIARDASAEKVQQNLIKLVDLMKELGIEGDISIPSKQKILQKALEQKIQNNLQEIHSQIAALKQEELEKAGIGNTVKAAGLGAAIAMSPMKADAKAVKKPKMTFAQAQMTAKNIDKIKTPSEMKAEKAQSKVKKPKKDMVGPPASLAGNKKLTHVEMHKQISKDYPLLGAIGQVESSGGKNLKHPTINDGILKSFYKMIMGKKKSMHEGMTAGGTFGMMPISAAYIVKNDPELAKKYPKLAEAAEDVTSRHKEFTDTFNSDPQADADFAIAMFHKHKSQTKNDAQLAYSWLHGIKGSWNKYKRSGHKGIGSHPYVQNVMKRVPKTRKPALASVNLEKALMAGYGGAGAPMSRVGGAVIQPESLEQGRSFKYITCDSCGKEQVHAKHQVKCRECGSGMSFEKLYRALTVKK